MKELLKKLDPKFLIRLGYYLGGLAIGVIAVTYINKQKGTSFNYGPNARVLSQIRLKDTLNISPNAQTILEQYHLDSLDIAYVLHKGEWIRSKSNVHQTPCPDYWIEATIGKKIKDSIHRNSFAFIIERCEYTATIKEIKLN